MKPVQPLGATSPPKAQKNKEKSSTKQVPPQGATSPPKAQKNNEKSLPSQTKHGGKSSYQPQLPAEKLKPVEKEAEAKGSGKAANSRSKLVNKDGKKSVKVGKKDSSKPKPTAKSTEKKKKLKEVISASWKQKMLNCLMEKKKTLHLRMLLLSGVGLCIKKTSVMIPLR